MTINPTNLDRLLQTGEFIPQAVIRQPITAIVDHFKFEFEQGHDDFDSYEGIGLMLNDELPFALMHYKGHPYDTCTIYMPDHFEDIDHITTIIGNIMTELGVPKDQLIWQRKDDPEL